MIDPCDVMNAARSYVGTPFAHQGRSRRGIDCVGLVICVARDIGLEKWRDGSSTADPFVYGTRLANSELLSLCQAKFYEKPKEELAGGDVVVLSSPKMPGHVAIVAEHSHYLTLIHCVNTHNEKCVEHRFMPELRKAVAGVFGWNDTGYVVPSPCADCEDK